MHRSEAGAGIQKRLFDQSRLHTRHPVNRRLDEQVGGLRMSIAVEMLGGVLAALGFGSALRRRGIFGIFGSGWGFFGGNLGLSSW